MIVMWNVIVSLIFFYIILPTWRSGLKRSAPGYAKSQEGAAPHSRELAP